MLMTLIQNPWRFQFEKWFFGFRVTNNRFEKNWFYEQCPNSLLVCPRENTFISNPICFQKYKGTHKLASLHLASVRPHIFSFKERKNMIKLWSHK